MNRRRVLTLSLVLAAAFLAGLVLSGRTAGTLGADDQAAGFVRELGSGVRDDARAHGLGHADRGRPGTGGYLTR